MGGLASVTADYPLTGLGTAGSHLALAFGTTTSNTWGGTQTFTNTPKLATLSGLIAGNAGNLYQVASSSLFGFTPISNALAKGNFIVGNDAGTAQATSTLFISSIGRIGIGTTTPNNKLDIYSTTKSAIGFSGASGSTYKWTMGMDVSNGGRFSIASSTALGTTDRLVILGNGNVGIATTSPTEQFSVAGRMYVGGTGTSTIENNLWVQGALRTGTGSTYLDINGLSSLSGNLTVQSKSANYLLLNPIGGNVGIGTTTPVNNKLDIYSTTKAAIGFSGASGDTKKWTMGYDVSNNRFAISSSTALGTNDRLVILGNGNVGINVTAPAFKLQVNGTQVSGAALIANEDILSLEKAENAPTQRLQATFGLQKYAADNNSDTQLNISLRNTSTLATIMSLRSNGNVGIGTSTPVSTLSIQGSLCVRSTGSCGTGAGEIYTTGGNISNIDVAENYPTYDESIEPGDVVMLSPQRVSYPSPAGDGTLESIGTLIKANTINANTPILGVISTKPGILFGYDIKDVPVRAVALSGRVPVKVSAENGAIQINDRITISSTTPGVGVRASDSDNTVGIALEPLTSGSGKIMVFISLQQSKLASPLSPLNSPAISVDNSGNVGIGTTLPTDKLTVSGNVLANGYAAPLAPATSFTLGSSTVKAEIPPSVLTAGGNVDLYKLATYTLSGVQALVDAQIALTVRVDSLESRLVKLENGSIATSTSVFSTSTLTTALNELGIMVQKGIAQFGTLVARQFVASSDADGTSSAASVTILAGNTVAQINNSLVHSTTKVFVTFNAQVTG
ncbi:hypothetical protein A3G63_02355 [Candidatus Kaiserbacteria bacterium RIFCSPLOWO2_12_FULL_52_8]|nr:MAG: hypothetical protein A3G63_02355 [Candidatus Kaiserbacteria bacterium RIFCSPLOWO2_12_FULL_52_8]